MPLGKKLFWTLSKELSSSVSNQNHDRAAFKVHFPFSGNALTDSVTLSPHRYNSIREKVSSTTLKTPMKALYVGTNPKWAK